MPSPPTGRPSCSRKATSRSASRGGLAERSGGLAGKPESHLWAGALRLPSDAGDHPPPGHQRPAARGGPPPGVGARHPRSGGRGPRLRPDRHPGLRGNRDVRAGDRGGHRRGGEGDVLLHRPGRSPAHAPPGGHPGGAPGRARRPPGAGAPPGEGPLRGADVPLRPAPGRPLPRVLAARHRGDRRALPGPRRGGDRGRLALLRGAGRQRAEPPGQHPGGHRGPAALPSRPGRVLHPAPESPLR